MTTKFPIDGIEMNSHPNLHNNPPDPIDAALAPYGDDIAEAESWLDGRPVETEAQMLSADNLLKSIKAAKRAVEAAEESEAKPIYDQWKAAKARFAPTITDLDRIAKGLVAIVDTFKRALAAKKAEAERAARAEAEARRLAAIEAARAAEPSDLESQRAAAAAQEQAEAAARAVAVASKDKVKGLRIVSRYEIVDHRALLHHIARTDRDAFTAFIDEWARKNHKITPTPEGLRVWTEKEAF